MFVAEFLKVVKTSLQQYWFSLSKLAEFEPSLNPTKRSLNKARSSFDDSVRCLFYPII